ncbi:MAG: 3-phosphoshikimate 1-carboxyvinyltransferase [Candidatus Omnitrophica bacterium]|nr:3-phosphoshikimate 1-carboxyvinyltransferase [Candidatus Omnitrophota bacterium]
MRFFSIKPISYLNGEVELPGDKSIAHRAIIISAISQGPSLIINFPANKDCLHTIKAFKKLGVRINLLKADNCHSTYTVKVFGKGLCGLKKPNSNIYVGDSGTTLRLILGVLAGQDFEVVLTAGSSLSQRPMLRVTLPLRLMGAQIKARSKVQKSDTLTPEEYPPIIIKGARLKPITYKIPVASAQVKSAILLAGLYAKGKTTVIEPIRTRDHTERMLKLFKADIKVKKNIIVIRGKKQLISPEVLYIPGDISSASFFIVSAIIVPNSQILIRNVGLNPSRLGIIRVLRRMGGKIELSGSNFQVPVYNSDAPSLEVGEPIGDILVKSSTLRGTIVKDREIPSLIDELPILMVAACYASGKTVFEGVGELRVKETDRIRSMLENLKKMGADIRLIRKREKESIVIRGVKRLKGASVKSFADHRTAMSLVVAGLNAEGKTRIDDISCISKSFPDFIRILKKIIS